MQVVGITNQQEFWVASKNNKFKINEMLIVEDSEQGTLIGEVIETSSYNRYIPFSINNAVVDANVLKSLEALGYDINSDTIHIAKIKLLIETSYPVETGAIVRNPKFEEVKKYLMPLNINNSLLIGMIKSTEEIYKEIPKEFENVLQIYEQGSIRKQSGIPFYFDLYAMSQYPHIGIFGGSGSGKSFSIRVLLEELMEKSIPSVIFDPHFEMDFCLCDKGKDFSNKFKCFTVGQDVGVNFLDLNTGDLKNLLSSAGFLTDGMISAIDTLHKKKDSFNSFYERIELLSEGLEIGKPKVDQIAHSNSNEAQRYMQISELLSLYGNQVSAQSVRGLVWRLRRLQQDGIFNNDISPIITSLKNGILVVIQGSARLLQVFASYLLYNIYQKRRNYRDNLNKANEPDYFPPFMVLTDEAHNFAPKGFDVPAKSILREISQEGRKYGVFLILATQRPSLLDETITAQLNTKFVFRIVRATDIQVIREETDLTVEETRRLPYLQSGDAFISSAIMGRTIPIRIRKSYSQSPHFNNPFEELKEKKSKSDDQTLELLKQYLPISETSILRTIESIFNETGKQLSNEYIIEKLESLVEQRKLIKHKTPFGIRYEECED